MQKIEIAPWNVCNSHYFGGQPPTHLSSKANLLENTVIVSRMLHGLLTVTAQELAVVFNDLFGGVIYAGLDTDKFKYPTGSGRVTFSNRLSYMKAVGAASIGIKTPRFRKIVQVTEALPK